MRHRLPSPAIPHLPSPSQTFLEEISKHNADSAKQRSKRTRLRSVVKLTDSWITPVTTVFGVNQTLPNADGTRTSSSQRRTRASALEVLNLGQRLWQRAIVAFASNDKVELQHTLRVAALRDILGELGMQLNCDAIILVPVTGKHPYAMLPRLVVSVAAFSNSKSDPESEAALARVTDWIPEDQQLRTPAGECLRTKQQVVVDCLPLDERFVELTNVASERTTRLHCLSQLCVPVFGAGDPGNIHDLGTSQQRMELSAGSDDADLPIIGIIKCINKIAFSGSASGVPFDKQFDSSAARIAAAKLFETSETFIARHKAMTVLHRGFRASLARRTQTSLADVSSTRPKAVASATSSAVAVDVHSASTVEVDVSPAVPAAPPQADDDVEAASRV